MRTIFSFLLPAMLTLTNSVSSIAQWQQLKFPGESDVQCFAVKPVAGGMDSTNLFAGTWGDGVFRSSDEGETWTQVNEGLIDSYVITLAVIPSSIDPTQSNLFAGTNLGLFVSTNNGSSWSEADSGLTNLTVYAISQIDTVLIAGTWGGGVYRSTNEGRMWDQTDLMLVGKFVNSFVVSPTHDGTGRTNLFAGTYGDGVFLSTDEGMSWTAVNKGISDKQIRSLVGSITPTGVNLFAAAGQSGLFRSTNDGKTWVRKLAGIAGCSVMTFVVDASTADTSVIAATWGGGVVLSHDGGLSWSAVDTGLLNMYIWSLGISPSLIGNGERYLFAGTGNHGVWRRPVSELVDAVTSTQSTKPGLFSLDQNYPNPFNPNTVISYQLSVNSYVTLKVYDILGRELETLVSGRQTAGYHSVSFDASDLRSGVYFYKLQAGSLNQTKKLTVLK